jgi:hypothetical protein
MTTLVAVCCGGLEAYVSEDLAKRVPEEVTIEPFAQSTDTSHALKVKDKWCFRGDGGCGKLILRNVKDVSFIHKVRSVQCWLVHLAHSTSLPMHRSDGIDHIQAIQALTRGVNFEEALEQWLTCLNPEWSERLVDVVQKRRKPTFCVRCIRYGTCI